MSRSHKKYPHFTDNNRGGAKWAKRKANKRVRRIKGLWNRGSYKRLFNPYDIHDYIDVEFNFNKNDPLHYKDWKGRRIFDPNRSWWKGDYK